MGVQLDRFSIALLILRPDAPVLDDEAAARLQNAHMAHLAELHEAGHLLAAGPLLDENFRGLSILNVEPDRARELKEADPAVRAGRFSVKVIPWIVPRGAVSYSPTRFPRSMSEVAEA
ncbi:MAG TPA: YciI family protein [Candidatus Nitrosotalea sp.]|nr:YciI family protein [Candidatus Nitrosotalea sp.]